MYIQLYASECYFLRKPVSREAAGRFFSKKFDNMLITPIATKMPILVRIGANAKKLELTCATPFCDLVGPIVES